MYKFFIGLADNSIVLELPVLPPALKVSHPGNNKTYDIVDFGEIIIPQTRKLITVGFESHFPMHKAPFVSSEVLREPTYYLSALLRWKEQKQVLKFVMSGSSLPVDLYYMLDTFEYEERAGDVGSLYYTIVLKEYRKVSAKRVNLVQQNGTTSIIETPIAPRPVTTPKPNVYSIKSGDTLWAIAKRYLNDGSRYGEIATLNSIKNPNTISVGQQIKLPEVS